MLQLKNAVTSWLPWLKDIHSNPPGANYRIMSRAEQAVQARRAVNGLATLINPKTGLVASHPGHPGYDSLGFTYDEAACALVFHAMGQDDHARQILDYYHKCLSLPPAELASKADTNNVFGILKYFQRDNSPGGVAIINAIDVTATEEYGRGQLEFYSTPGPMSFLVYAMCAVDPYTYFPSILAIGESLLAMQDSYGGIVDGDRAPDRVHTEPHIDTISAFLMIHQLTGDKKWKIAADKGFQWFEKNVFHPGLGTIDQGMWQKNRSRIFATDCYSWTMAGPTGDRMDLATLKSLTRNMLRQGLVMVTLTLPDGTERTLILTDFSNPRNSRVVAARNGFHPMGSMEWTGGVVLALQKNAVRMYNGGDQETARLYKAIAEILLSQTMRAFFDVDGTGHSLTFYSSGQGVEVAPFGAIYKKSASGWKTPFFFGKDKKSGAVVKGGSAVGAWPVLPYARVNPFILNDQYGKAYDAIHVREADRKLASSFIKGIVESRSYSEKKLPQLPDPAGEIVEPHMFNRSMWQALSNADLAKSRGDFEEERAQLDEAMKWARRVVDNSVWTSLAKRDNDEKQRKYGGIIYYPWGAADDPAKAMIEHYPILNEIATAVWALAVINFELGNTEESADWIKKMISDYPDHQIAVVSDGTEKKIVGYWNALISWEDNPGFVPRDSAIGYFYREVLLNLGLTTAKPRIISNTE